MFRTVSPSVISNTPHVSDGLSVHHQESKTTYSIRYMSYRFCGCLLTGTKWGNRWLVIERDVYYKYFEFFPIVKTNQICNISNLFYFGTTLYMFRTVSPSIIRNLRLYIQHQVYVIQVLWLFASGNEMEHLVLTSKQSTESLWHVPDAVCTVLDSWWLTERPKYEECYYKIK